MRTLLIGSQGQLGTDLRRRLHGDVIGLDWPKLDVRDVQQVRAVLHEQRPGVVINCAAQTNVDLCEDEPDEAFAVNALGALHVARSAEQVGAAVTYISTDYVFGAGKDPPDAYTENDRPGPLGVYGASKLAGEHLTLAYCSRALVVRTSGLYGTSRARGKGTNFVETMLRLARGRKPVRVVNDQRLSPTSTRELAGRLVAVLETDVTGIIHLAAQDSCTWYEFAREIFEHEGLDVNLLAISSTEYLAKARRPSVSALQSVRVRQLGIAPCGSWREMLHDYLRVRPVRRTSHESETGSRRMRVS